MLHIHFSNRLEPLREWLLGRLMRPGASPFVPDEVVVPSAAHRRHLTLSLARARGICAQVRFSYLARWLWERVATMVPGVGGESPFAPALLRWRVFSAFNDGDWVAAHPRLSRYLAAADPLMVWDLANRVAHLLDDYVTYRPDWLDRWAQGGSVSRGGDTAEDDQVWQAALWRRLLQEADLPVQRPLDGFFQALSDRHPTATVRDALPPEVHVFALPAVAPLHLRMLRALADHIEVHVYALNPCAEYWFDVVTPKRMAALRARARALHAEQGHALLSAWGCQTQAQMQLLVGAVGDLGVIDDSHFVPSAKPSLLGRLQDGILNLEDLAPGAAQALRGDRSIEVHIGHSLSRELEVLHNRLLGLFAQDPSLQPEDVVVVTPDLQAAVPLVQAVFGTVPPSRHIPFVITGLGPSGTSTVASAYLRLLELADSRVTISDFLGVLQQPVVARRFGLEAQDISLIRQWLQDAGMHWALDADHQMGLGLPLQGRYSLDDGLQRLFLSYALPDDAPPLLGRLPAGGVEGTEAQTLGALWSVVQALVQMRADLAADRPAAQWPALLMAIADEFLDPLPQEQPELQGLRQAIDALAHQFGASGLTGAVGHSVVRAALSGELDEPARGGVPTGAVTFASMASLRGLPYRVVCMVGLDDASFPSRAAPLEFDLMAVQPRLGDRQRRLDDRNLFLDLLLAARDWVHISFTGRSVRDNAPLRGSVVVEELLEVLAKATADDPSQPESVAAARAQLCVEHPLQPFDERAFAADGDKRVQGYQQEYLQALQAAQDAALRGAVQAPAVTLSEEDEDAESGEGRQDALPQLPLFSAPLPPPGSHWREVSLEQLTRFFRNPCGYVLRQRLGLVLSREHPALEDDEPSRADTRQRRRLAKRLLPALLEGASLPSVLALAAAGPDWPAGAPAVFDLQAELVDLQRFALQLRNVLDLPPLAAQGLSQTFTIDGETWRLQGALAGLRPEGQWMWDPAARPLRAQDRLQAWLHHLALCAAAPGGVTPQTTWLARDGVLRFTPCDDAVPLLHGLLGLYRRGLMQPLPFFPETSWAFVASGGNLETARNVWSPPWRAAHGEQGDAAIRLALRGLGDPLITREFRDVAQAVLEPLRAHLQEDR